MVSQTTCLHPALSCAAASIFLQLYLYPAVHISLPRSLFQAGLFLGRLHPLWPLFGDAVIHVQATVSCRPSTNLFTTQRNHKCKNVFTFFDQELISFFLVVVTVLLLVGASSSNKAKAPSFQVGSVRNLAGLFFN